MKLTSFDAITVRTLANQAALSIRYSRLYISPDRVTACRASAAAYIDSAKTVARFAKISGKFS